MYPKSLENGCNIIDMIRNEWEALPATTHNANGARRTNMIPFFARDDRDYYGSTSYGNVGTVFENYKSTIQVNGVFDGEKDYWNCDTEHSGNN